jgi:hypothetical protein
MAVLMLFHANNAKNSVFPWATLIEELFPILVQKFILGSKFVFRELFVFTQTSKEFLFISREKKRLYIVPKLFFLTKLSLGKLNLHLGREREIE